MKINVKQAKRLKGLDLKCTGEYVLKKTCVLFIFSSRCIHFNTVSKDFRYASSTLISILTSDPSWKKQPLTIHYNTKVRIYNGTHEIMDT